MSAAPAAGGVRPDGRLRVVPDAAAGTALDPSSVAAVVLPPPRSAWRRLLARPALMHHHRLVALVLLVNVVVLGWCGTRAGWWARTGLDVDLATNAAMANVTLAVLVRQQYVINVLFRLATLAPVRWPLRVRATLGKVYHFGGLHVGAAAAGTLWFLAGTGTVLHRTVTGVHPGPPAPAVVAVLTAALLAGIAATALPPVRARHHDLFERSHRFGGWAVLGLLWVDAALSATAPGGTGQLVRSPRTWLLVVVTVSVAMPWLRLRRVPVTVERPSSHVALARFDYGVTPFAGSSTAVSRRPLLEWHSFANVPAPGIDGFRLTISRAGDWTGAFVDDPPTRVWVKGIPTAGVANIETLFTKVVYVATGSGIGPVLPHLLAARVPALLVWATRSPRATYGDGLIDEILAAQPDAIVWDTALHGKPDMVGLAYAAYIRSGAEAVICISNKTLTWQVVHGLECRGIPAYGAIWDS